MFGTKFIVSLLLCGYCSHALQMTSNEGEGLWIAIIDDNADCNEMTSTIKNMVSGHRRVLGSSSVGTLEELSVGKFDCFVHFSAPSLTVVDAVRAVPGVVSVEPDEEVSLFETWGRDRADQDNLPLDNKNYMPPYTGIGQCLYIVDTGIFKEHNDFTGRAEYGADFIGESNPSDNNGHGTHCSSTAAGAKYGIAPETSTIKGVKVLSATGSGSSAGVIKGIQWAVNDAGSKTCVISMSLGGPENAALDKAAQDAAKKHIVVVAAGNSNMDACRGSPSGAGGNVITVGSTKRDDYRSSFSNYGSCVDIFGPGSDITAAYKGSKTSTAVLSGTSMATPYIAGIALQMLQKNGGNLGAAYNDLFAAALGGKVKDAGKGSRNLLGRIVDYTGPPTPPTLKPTTGPTMPEPSLCKYNTKRKNWNICADFHPSSFGTDNWKDVPIRAQITWPSNVADKHMCKKTSDDFTGKLVLVERGSCLFFDKVKNCENQGALGVIIYNNIKGNAAFPPAYYGKGTTTLPSCMIGNTDGVKIFRNNDLVNWGALLDGGKVDTPTPPPTPLPTASPTPVFRCDGNADEATCTKEPKCAWDGFVCYIRLKYQNKSL